MASDLLLRPATGADGPALAEVFRAARAAAGPAMPPPARTRGASAWDPGGVPAALHETWVAEDGGTVVGLARFTDVWLDDLYVHPDSQGTGVGTALIELVQALRPDGFSLWVFASNLPARAFYARHGLAEREHTDGRDNEEGEPDLRMEWPGRTAPPAARRPVPGGGAGSVGGSS